MIKRITAILLSVLLAVTVVLYKPVEVKASSAVIAGATYSAMSEAELLALIAQYGAVAVEACPVVLGAAAFSYLATKGITWAVESSVSGAKTLGNYLVENYSSLGEDLQSFISSVVTNISSDASYYENYAITITNGIISDLNDFFSSSLNSGTISTNIGNIATDVIPSSYLSTLSDNATAYSYYTAMTNPIYIDNSSGSTYYFPYYIYGVPSDASYAVVSYTSSANTYSLTFYDSNGEQVVVSNYTAYYVYYNALSSTGSWAYSRWTTSAITLAADWADTVDFNGFPVYEQSDEDITPYVSDYTLDIDIADAYTYPVTLTNDLVISVDDAIDLGTGTISLDDVADYTVTTEADTGTTTDTSTTTGLLNTIIGWLSDILDAILSIPTAIANMAATLWEWLQSILSAIQSLASDIASAISDVLTDLFVPSQDTVDELSDMVDEKLPIIGQIQNWNDSIVYALNNPEDYTSNLTFIVDTSKADTYWDYGDTQTNMLDLSWYLNYKDFVDGIIVGVAWLIFLWNLYGRLPAIISAVGQGVMLDATLDDRVSDVEKKRRKG